MLTIFTHHIQRTKENIRHFLMQLRHFIHHHPRLRRLGITCLTRLPSFNQRLMCITKKQPKLSVIPTCVDDLNHEAQRLYQKFKQTTP
jgi:hypothetical protein